MLTAVGLTPIRPRTISRWARSMRDGRSAQCPQSELVQGRLSVGQDQAGDAVIVLIRRFYWSRADLANCSHNDFSRWSRFWRNCCGHRILYCRSSSSVFACNLHTSRQLANRTSGEEFPWKLERELGSYHIHTHRTLKICTATHQNKSLG